MKPDCFLRDLRETVEVVTLAHVRRVAGLTQQQVADRMGVTRSWVTRIEQAWPKVKLSTAQRYAHACGARLRLEIEPPDNDDDYPGGWFGESWAAPVCDPDTHKPTPTDEDCFACQRPIRPGDQGMVMPYVYEPGKSRLTYEHLDCFLRGLRAGEDA